MVRRRITWRPAVSLLAAAALLAAPMTLSVATAAQAATAAQTVADAMQPGWNLGNSFDAIGSDETAWGNPVVTQALITNIRAQGFKSIRIPVSWGQHEGGAPSYTIDTTFLNRVKTVVDYALAADLYVMLDIHHDSWQWVTNLPGRHDAVLAQFNATWTQLAAAFKDRSAKLLFESINEQSFTGSSGDTQSYALQAELNSSFRNIVRASGGNNATRLLVLPTLYDNGDQGRLDALAAELTGYNDSNIITTVHYYGYWPFSTNIAGTTTFDATTQADLVSAFDRLSNTFVSKGIPVIIGEYGLLGFDKNTGTIEQGEKLKYFEYFGHYAKAKNLTTVLWDNGQHFDRTNFVWKDPDLFATIKASWSGRSATASTDQIFVNKSAAAAAQSVTLNLNGTSLAKITQGSTTLVAGTDYTLSGSTLTFPAASIDKLSGSKAYGTNATLTATFSSGAPWKFSIITYDTPVLSNATGDNGLVIPTQFRGDKLATMTATYADGSGAGPQNWTPYKEFDYAFSPDHAANTITITDKFVAETNNGTVNLTFYFWSGAQLKYTMVKNQSAITGTASSTPVTTTTTTTTTSPTTTTTSPTTTTTRPTTTTTRPTTTSSTTTTTRPTTTSSTTTTTTSTTTGAGKTCTATYSVVGQWPGGFQGDVKVTAGSGSINGWRVTWSFANGQTVSQSWGSTLAAGGGAATASNLAWNGALGGGASTTFGFVGSWNNSTNGIPTLACTAS